MRKQRKIYICARESQYGKYRSALVQETSYLLVDTFGDADIICVIKEKEGLSVEQRRKLLKAKDAGVEIKVIASSLFNGEGLRGKLEQKFKTIDRELGAEI
ncbi:hypothetical protein M2140_001791 [Clostridiales Family XIII bacterium PM5-7]